MQGFSSHQQFIDDLIQGMQNGTIAALKIDVHMDVNGITYYNVEFVDQSRAAHLRQPPQLSQAVQAMPGAKIYNKGAGIKLSKGTEPVTGFRDFNLQDTIHGLLLRSRNGAFWPARERFRALCQKEMMADHDVPSLDCECGVYAYDTADHPSLKKDQSLVWGEIAMWGDVLLCDSGFRAEFAYPTALFIRDTSRSKTVLKIQDELAENYGVPVFLVKKRSGQTSSQMIEEALSTFLAEPTKKRKA